MICLKTVNIEQKLYKMPDGIQVSSLTLSFNIGHIILMASEHQCQSLEINNNFLHRTGAHT